MNKPRPRIAVISNLYHPYVIGGAEMLARKLAIETASEFDVSVVSTRSPGNLIEETLDGIRVIRFFPWNLYWVKEKPDSRLQKTLWHGLELANPIVMRQVQQILELIKPDIVHTHNIDSFSPLVWLAARRSGAKVVHTAHDGHLICPKANFVHTDVNASDCKRMLCLAYRNWKVWFTRYIDVFCSPSQFLLKEHQKHGLNSHRNVVIANGIEELEFDSSIARVENSYLTIGHLSEAKGIALLIELLHENPELKIHLTLAGEGPLKNLVQKTANDDARVHYAGKVSGNEKRSLFSSHHTLLLPTLCFENSPTVILEAMQAKMVIIAPIKGGIPEMLSDYPAKILYDANSRDSLLAAIQRAPDLTPATSQVYPDRYRLGTMVNSYLKLYREILE